MQVKILKPTRISGERASPGDVVEASRSDAKYLINTGKAEEAQAPAPKRTKAKPAAKANASD